MLGLEMSFNVFLLLAIVFFAFCVGFILRSRRINSLRKKITELEREMLSNHAYILELQKEKTILQHKLTESKIPVISLNTPKEENPSEKVSDISKKKKTL